MFETLPQTYDQTPGHLVAATVILGLIDILAVSGRFYARKKQAAPLKADDWFSAAALILTVGYGILVLYAVSKHSLGYHVVFPPEFRGSPLDFQSPQTRLAAITQFSYQIVTPLTVGCYKASILFFYLRVFAVDRRQLIAYLLIAFVGLVVAWMLGFFFAFLFQCGTKVWAQWAVPSVDLANCPHQTALNSSLCISDFILDIIIFLIPVPLVWRLNMSKERRLGVCAVFAIGSVTVIASLVRLVEEIDLVRYGFNPRMDQQYFLTREAYWVIVVMGTGTFSVCLPSLHVLFGSGPLSSMIRSTRSFFYYFSSKTASSFRLRDPKGDYDNDNSESHQGRNNDHIHVVKAVDVEYAMGNKLPNNGWGSKKTPSHEDYLLTTTETHATSTIESTHDLPASGH
ncbi:hypothetical protein F4678DRAFT_435786 [Xylaria arbuscula]|nr:hypothetical protein F4678DRAFT_435786 [Xylaria arbuscula]